MTFRLGSIGATGNFRSRQIGRRVLWWNPSFRLARIDKLAKRGGLQEDSRSRISGKSLHHPSSIFVVRIFNCRMSPLPIAIATAFALLVPESWAQSARAVTNLKNETFSSEEVIRALEHKSTVPQNPVAPPVRIKGLNRNSSTPDISQSAPVEIDVTTVKAVSIQLQFDFDSATLSQDSIRKLEVLSRALTSERLGQLRFRVIGHTDRRGGYAYNLSLSERRAEAVSGYLHRHGLAAERLTTVGRSYDELLDIDAPGGAANRRVEIESFR